MEYKWDISPRNVAVNQSLKYSLIMSLTVLGMVFISRVATNLVVDEYIFDFRPIDFLSSVVISLMLMAIPVFFIITFVLAIKVYSDTCALRLKILNQSRSEYQIFFTNIDITIYNKFRMAGLTIVNVDLKILPEHYSFSTEYNVTEKPYKMRISMTHSELTVFFDNVAQEDIRIFHLNIKGLIEESLDEVFKCIELENRN